jgi:DNA polymerase (family 10)
MLKYDKILEINSQPNRLDLADDLVQEAVRLGIKLVIDTDAHDTGSLHFMKYGIGVARRGHAERRNIINTLNYEDMLEVIKKA